MLTMMSMDKSSSRSSGSSASTPTREPPSFLGEEEDEHDDDRKAKRAAFQQQLDLSSISSPSDNKAPLDRVMHDDGDRDGGHLEVDCDDKNKATNSTCSSTPASCPICLEDFAHLEQEAAAAAAAAATEPTDTATGHNISSSNNSSSSNFASYGSFAEEPRSTTTTTAAKTTAAAKTTTTATTTAAAAASLRVFPCGHWFCRECLREHCAHWVAARRVPIPCPHHVCEKTLSVETVETVLVNDSSSSNNNSNNNINTSPTAVWTQFQRLHRRQQEPDSWAECPFCGALVATPPPSSSSEPTTTTTTTSTTTPPTNDLECDACLQEFCRIHGTSHLGIPCAAFTSSSNNNNSSHHDAPSSQHQQAYQQWVATEQALRRYTKPCSHCQAALQKAAGCDHVVCTACHQDMCWKCGTHQHLTGKLVRHCARCDRDYRDHRYDHIYRNRMCLLLPILVPFVMLYVAVVLTVCLATGCFGGCFRCGRCFAFANRSGSGNSSNNNNNNNRPADRMTVHWDDDDRTTRGNARLGFYASFIIVFLPIVLLLEDFGVHWRLLDDLFPEPENEMPVLEVSHTVETEADGDNNIVANGGDDGMEEEV